MAAKKFDFATQYREQVRFRTDSGSRMKTEYEPVYDRTGKWHLEKCGEKDIYLEIQSHADSVDLNIIMERYRNGETDVLKAVQGTYGDVSNIPTNYAELMNTKLQAESLFMSLSADVREKYNNSVEQFMSELGTKDGLEKLGVSFDAPAPVPSSAPASAPSESEVKE